jgi:hypothetical protein
MYEYLWNYSNTCYPGEKIPLAAAALMRKSVRYVRYVACSALGCPKRPVAVRRQPPCPGCEISRLSLGDISSASIHRRRRRSVCLSFRASDSQSLWRSAKANNRYKFTGKSYKPPMLPSFLFFIRYFLFTFSFLLFFFFGFFPIFIIFSSCQESVHVIVYSLRSIKHVTNMNVSSTKISLDTFLFTTCFMKQRKYDFFKKIVHEFDFWFMIFWKLFRIFNNCPWFFEIGSWFLKVVHDFEKIVHDSQILFMNFKFCSDFKFVLISTFV